MPFLFILAALPAAAALDAALSVAAWQSEKHIKDMRARRLMAGVMLNSAQSGAAERIAAAVRKEFDGKGTSPYKPVTIGGVAYFATDEQVDLLNEALEEPGDARALLLLMQIRQQTLDNTPSA
jgi:hypothetical protein